MTRRTALPFRASGVLVGLLLAHAPAARANTPGECISLWSGLSRSGQTQGIAQQDFMAACLAHRTTSNPTVLAAPDTAPPGATGRCRDGFYTTAAVPLGACQHHGGLAGLIRP